MKVCLYHRHHGVHKPIKTHEIPVSYTELSHRDETLDESLLIDLLPPNWLPVPPKDMLLTVTDQQGCGTGLIHLAHFKPWAKYFDSYVLDLERE